MEIYLIGFLFTLGYLTRFDKDSEVKGFSGFWGSLTLFFMCVVWPFAVGVYLAGINTDE